MPLEIAFEGGRPPERIAVEVTATELSMGRSAGLWKSELSKQSTLLDLPVPESTRWLIEVRAQGYWSSGVVLTSAAGAAVALVRTTTVLGKLVTPERLATDAHLTVAFQQGPVSDSKEREAFPHKLGCTITLAAWTCPMPVGTWDLRFAVPGHAPVYRWGQRITEERSVDVGTIVFKTGASVSGWVVGRSGNKSFKAIVEAAPFAQPAALDQPDRRAPLLRSVACDTRGFFQLSDLAPGEYWIQAEFEDLVSQRVKVITSTDEVRLAEPLQLRAPQLSEVEVDPAADPYGEPWVVYIHVPSGLGERAFVEHSHGVVGSDGRWRSPRRLATTAIVKVVDSQGSTWASTSVDATAEPPALVPISIPLVRIRGHLTFDGSGVAGKIFFGGSRGPESIRIQADSEGRFEGALPRPGRWMLEVKLVEDVLLALEDVEVSRPRATGVATVDIALPRTRIRGRVLESAHPARALIVATRDDGKGTLGGRAFSAETHEDGTWELIGMPPGHVAIQAYSADSESEWVSLEVNEGLELPEVLLELQRKAKTRGWLTDGSNAVAGGVINTLPSAGRGRRLRSAIDGTFWIEYSTSASRVDMVVVPPSAGASLNSIAAPSQAELAIVVGPPAGSLIVPSLYGSLAWRGVVVPMGLVVSAFDAAGRLDVVPGQGYRLNGLAGGTWTWCPEAGGSCESAELDGTGDVTVGTRRPAIAGS